MKKKFHMNRKTFDFVRTTDWKYERKKEVEIIKLF